MKKFALKTTGLLFLFVLAFASTTFAQEKDKKVKKKVVTVTTTTDENGRTITKKVVKEGDEVTETEIKEILKEVDEKNSEIKVNVTVDDKGENEDIQIIEVKDGKEKTYEIKINGEDVEIEGDGEKVFIMRSGGKKMKSKDGNVFIFKSDDDDDDDDDEHEDDDGDGMKIIKMKGDSGEDIQIIIEKGGDGEMVFSDNPDRAFLGVMVDMEVENQVKVTDVVEGSAAEKAGLKSGDVVTAINEKPVKSFDELIDVLDGLKAGDNVQISYDREGKTKHAKAALTKRTGEHKAIIKELHSDEDHGDIMKWVEKEGGDEDGTYEIIIEEEIIEEDGKKKKIIKKKKIKKEKE